MVIQITLPQESYDIRRRWPRYKIDVPVRLIVQRPTNVVIVLGRGRALNRGGMAIFAGIELSLDERVAAEFTPPYYGLPVRVRGLVRNRSGDTYGIEFITGNDDDYRNAGQIEFIFNAMGGLVS